MAINLNGPSTITFIQGAHLSGLQFKWAPNNNIDPKGPSPLNLIFPNNLNGPPTVIFKWALNNNIDLGAPFPLNLIFANQFK